MAGLAEYPMQGELASAISSGKKKAGNAAACVRPAGAHQLRASAAVVGTERLAIRFANSENVRTQKEAFRCSGG